LPDLWGQLEGAVWESGLGGDLHDTFAAYPPNAAVLWATCSFTDT
jgi:hypothetical protein